MTTKKKKLPYSGLRRYPAMPGPMIKTLQPLACLLTPLMAWNVTRVSIP